MSVRITGHGDLDKAAGLQQAAFDHFERGMERARRGGVIAAHD